MYLISARLLKEEDDMGGHAARMEEMRNS